ncbi:MAG: hypothetical protein R3B91_10990 [Planctomycetaceae bacterium]
MFDWGMAMGPFAVGPRRRGRHDPSAGKSLDQIPDGYRSALVAQKLFDMGRYGQKTGAAGTSTRSHARLRPEINQLVSDTAKEAGIEQREIDDQEIFERCLYSLVNEGAKLLEEASPCVRSTSTLST